MGSSFSAHVAAGGRGVGMVGTAGNLQGGVYIYIRRGTRRSREGLELTCTYHALRGRLSECRGHVRAPLFNRFFTKMLIQECYSPYQLSNPNQYKSLSITCLEASISLPLLLSLYISQQARYDTWAYSASFIYPS